MNINHEINKARNNLQIPISNIVFQGPYAEIYSDGMHIGNLPFYVQAGIISLDTVEANLINLNWSRVYNKYQRDFFDLISDLLSDKDIELTPATFGNVYATNKTSRLNVGLFKCSYDGQKWNVHQVR